MADISKQPTILIKKADGTSERITLEEFKKRKQMAAQTKPDIVVEKKDENEDKKLKMEDTNSSQQRQVDLKTQSPIKRTIPVVEEVEKPLEKPIQRRAIPLVEESDIANSPQPIASRERVSIPVVSTEKHVAMTTPVINVFSQPATSKPAPKKIQPMDHSSLLEEDDSELRSLVKERAAVHEPAPLVAFSSSVKIPKDLEARMSALVLSWKKGIRDEHQFLEYAMKKERDGGLGLSQADAEKFFSEISNTATLSKAPQKPTSSPVSMVSQQRVPSQMKKIPATSIPTSAPIIREVDSRDTAPRVMGPVEESAAFTIEDFRRLSRDPKVAAEMILAKFNGWKDESYLLYLQVRDSWKRSPLFHIYIDETVIAIQKRMTVAQILEGNELTYGEYLAIADINHKLGMMD